jgi:hypothetical protein
MNRFSFWQGTIVLGLFLLPAIVHSAEPSVGQVSRITGAKFVEAGPLGGPIRKLAAGDAVFAGERIRTGKGTSTHIEFTDKTRFILGPDTEFEVEQYRHKQGGSGEEAFYSRVFKGAFRFVSGLIAHSKPGNMQVSLAVATLGIRGTHVEGEVTERQEKNGAMVDSSAKVVLLEPEGSDKDGSVLVENKFGSVVIDKPGYGTEIPDEKSPPSPVRKMQLRTIDNVLRAIRSPARQGGPARRP